jgi:hypothetical protein
MSSLWVIVRWSYLAYNLGSRWGSWGYGIRVRLVSPSIETREDCLRESVDGEGVSSRSTASGVEGE